MCRGSHDSCTREGCLSEKLMLVADSPAVPPPKRVTQLVEVSEEIKGAD